MKIGVKKLLQITHVLYYCIAKAYNIDERSSCSSSSIECRMAITLRRVSYTPLVHYLLFAPEKTLARALQNAGPKCWQNKKRERERI